MTLRADHVAGAFFIGVGLAGHCAERRPADRYAVAAGLRLHAEDRRRADDFLRTGADPAREREQSLRDRGMGRRQARCPGRRDYCAGSRGMFEWLGFLTTNVLLIFALLVVIERRKLLPAAVYSVGVVVVTYVLFVSPAEDAAANRSVRILGSPWKPPFSAWHTAFPSPLSRPTLWYAFLGCLVGHACRRFAGHRAAGRHFHPVAGDIRTECDAGHHHARRHLLRLAIWRLDHLDPDAHSGRSLVGDDLHRRLRDGKEGPRRRSALHCGGRLVDRRDLRRSGAYVGRAAARDHRRSGSGRRNTPPCSSSA